IVALLAFTRATLPASVLARPLGRAGVTAAAFGGTLWSGSAQRIAWRGTELGDLAWQLQPRRLLRGRIAGHATLRRTDGSLETGFDVAFSGRDLRLEQAEFTLPIAALASLPLGMPQGWRGLAGAAFEVLVFADGWPAEARGVVDLDGLVAPPPRNAPIGSFHAVFPHPRPQDSLSVPADASNITAAVTDTDGPFAVQAQLTLSRTRNFALEGTLVPRGPVPPAMERSLQMLGPADAAGRRQFSVGGTL
ncbi:MAG: type II secretion system protein N, partial [Steroidobacteraceae bacterium]